VKPRGLADAAAIARMPPSAPERAHDRVLKVLDTFGSGTEDLRAGFETFRTLCQQLTALIRDRRRTGQVFHRLVERFDDLFVHTDESLREMTRDLLRSVSLLAANLDKLKHALAEDAALLFSPDRKSETLSY
jgi:hypothetical protein